MQPLLGKVALVTGGSRGIGRAIALRLAEAGANVAICSRNLEAAQAVGDEISARGGNILVRQSDVADAAQVDQLIKDITGTLGSLDVLVNNAGINRDNLLLRMKEEEWDSGHEHQFERYLQLLQGCSPAHDQGPRRAHRQHFFRGRHQR